MKGTKCFLLAVVLVVGFFGCSENPTNPRTDSASTDSINLSVPMFVLQDSWQLNDSVWTYELALASRAFIPAVEDSASLLGMRADSKDWNDQRLGIIGRGLDGALIFRVSTKNTDKRINFVSGSNWAQLDSLKKINFFEASSGGGNLAIHFQNGTISRIGSTNGGRDTLYIVERIVNGDTLYDTLYHNDTTVVHNTDTLTVLLGDIVKINGDPINMGSGSWKNTILFSSSIVRLVTGGVPFAIGLPSWNRDSLQTLGTRQSDGYYPLVVTLKPGRYQFSVGGDYNKSWADSSILKQSYWGKKTSAGWVMELVVNKYGKIFPGSLVDTTSVPAVVVHDTVTMVRIIRDTLTIPGKTIIDTLLFHTITHDTVHVRDTVTNVVYMTKVVRDTITLPGKIIYDTLRINTVTHDTVHVRDTVALIMIDKGTVTDTSKSFLRDTSWLDVDSLKGVITEDTVVQRRSIHTVWWVSEKGDTTAKYDTTMAPVQIYRYLSDTVSFVIAQYGASKVGADTVYRFGITAKAFAYTGSNDDSVALIGLADTSKWDFVGKIGGYFVFDAKLAKGTTYNLNFVGNKGTWAKQEILLLSPLAVKVGGNCNIVCKVDGTGLIKP